MLLTDNNGRLRAPGRHKVTRVFDADAGTLPAGWTVGNGATEDTGVTQAWQAATAGPPGLILTSGTATGNTASTRRRAALIGSSFDASKCSAIRLRAIVTGGADPNILPRLGLASTAGSANIGMTLLHQVSADSCRLFTNGSAGSTSREISFKWVPAPARHDLTLWWTPRDGYVACAVEDDAVFYADTLGTAVGAGSVYPIVGTTAQANALTATTTVHRIELDFFYA